jgi:antitoxin component YwqK of YwqJK toxin-antitoxin module
MNARRLALLGISLVLLVPRAHADNSVSAAQQAAEEQYLQKVNFACGTQLTLAYDAESLKKTDVTIARDQTDGADECNEPLRNLWYACKTPSGQAAVRGARIARIVCRGTDAQVGSLSLSQGELVVERSAQERDRQIRGRAQFEKIIHARVAMPPQDPKQPTSTLDAYHDDEWRALRQKPNPVTSTKTYCLVNGGKVAFDWNVQDPFTYRKQDATVKCWSAGEVVIDLVMHAGVKTGFETHVRDDIVIRRSYRDGKQHGEQRMTRSGHPQSLDVYEDGREISATSYHPNGQLAAYSRTYPHTRDSVNLSADGKVQALTCSPASRDDKTLRKWCGFDGGATTSIYDGTGKVARVVTYKDGVLQKEAAGDSNYARGSTVAYVDGKKHGEERIVDKTGKLKQIINWNHGEQDGKAQFFGDDGKKVVKEEVWRHGERQLVTELYLNGNPKSRDTFDSREKRHHEEFWDTGKKSKEVTLLACPARGFGVRWCEDGLEKTWYEDGARESELSFRAGKQEGNTSTWWNNGKPESEEKWADGHLIAAKRWDETGKLTIDEEYEADGSRKIKR